MPVPIVDKLLLGAQGKSGSPASSPMQLDQVDIASTALGTILVTIAPKSLPPLISQPLRLAASKMAAIGM